MKTRIALVLCAISSLSFSQTDIIEMRSRNASLKTYAKASVTNKVDHISSNFGLDKSAMSMHKTLTLTAYLDSVKNIPEKGVVLFIRPQCDKNTLTENSLNQSPCLTIADTIFSEKLFRLNSSLDSVKIVLQRDYSMGLDMDSTRYIDFEDKQEIQPLETLPKENKEQENSIGWELIFMLITPMLFAFAVNRFVLPKSSN